MVVDNLFGYVSATEQNANIKLWRMKNKYALQSTNIQNNTHFDKRQITPQAAHRDEIAFSNVWY